MIIIFNFYYMKKLNLYKNLGIKIYVTKEKDEKSFIEPKITFIEDVMKYSLLWILIQFFLEEFKIVSYELNSYKNENIDKWLKMITNNINLSDIVLIDKIELANNLIIDNKKIDFNNFNRYEKDICYNLFLALHYVFAWLCEARKIKEFSTFINFLEDDTFDIIKEYLLIFIKRTKWINILEKDYQYNKIKQKININ